MGNSNIKIVIVGDCSNWNIEDYDLHINKNILKEIATSDLFIFNLEGSITKKKTFKSFRDNRLISFLLKLIGKKPPKVKSTAKLIKLLTLGKRNVACLANNHILDYGVDGLNDTIMILEKNEVNYLGAGENRLETSAVERFIINNSKISVINLNYIGWRKFGLFVNIYSAKKNSSGASYLTEKELYKLVTDEKKNGYFVIAILHIGRQNKTNLTSWETKILSSIPFDVSAIHHSHVSFDTSIKNVYSLGDFIFSNNKSLKKIRPGKMLILDNFKPRIIDLKIKNGIPVIN